MKKGDNDRLKRNFERMTRIEKCGLCDVRIGITVTVKEMTRADYEGLRKSLRASF